MSVDTSVDEQGRIALCSPRLLRSDGSEPMVHWLTFLGNGVPSSGCGYTALGWIRSYGSVAAISCKRCRACRRIWQQAQKEEALHG